MRFPLLKDDASSLKNQSKALQSYCIFRIVNVIKHVLLGGPTLKKILVKLLQVKLTITFNCYDTTAVICFGFLNIILGILPPVSRENVFFQIPLKIIPADARD